MELPGIELRRITTIGSSIVTAAGVILVTATFIDQPVLALVLCGVTLMAGYLAIIDFQQHRLPNVYTGPLAAFTTVGLGLCGYLYDVPGRTLNGILFGVGFTILFFVLHLVAKLGMGDVKYAYTVGLVTGWFSYTTLVTAFMITSLSAALAAVAILVVTRDTKLKIAYGPYMSLGLIIAVVFAT